jgi:hypothetical protein
MCFSILQADRVVVRRHSFSPRWKMEDRYEYRGIALKEIAVNLVENAFNLVVSAMSACHIKQVSYLYRQYGPRK